MTSYLFPWSTVLISGNKEGHTLVFQGYGGGNDSHVSELLYKRKGVCAGIAYVGQTNY
jgi:hypothetical protein